MPDRVLNPVLLKLEARCGLGPTHAANLLGMAYITYAKSRAGERPLQLYHQRHVEALLLLPRESLDKLIQKHAYAVE